MSGGARRRILFVTSNGTGLGHLTRSMAIARRLDPDLEPLFVTFSAAAPVVAGLGFPVEYLASYDRPGAGDDLSWTLRNRARLRRMVDEIEPAAVLFDGTHPYERLLASLRFADAPLVWSRRAMWRRDADTSALWRSHLFDAVLEPGDFAESADRGPTVSRRREAHRVGPMVLLDRSELLSREQAESELGLEPGRTNVLVSLGQGASIREASRRCLEHLAGRGDVQVAAVSSTLAGAGEVPPGVVALAATYPISRYLDAFDVAVSAAGYNGFSELVRLGPPALFVAMDRRTDDQAARASWVEQAGAGRAVESPSDPELERKLDELLDPELRAAMRSRLDGIEAPDGAAEAADWLGRLARPQGEAARLAETDLPGDSGLGSVPGTGAQAPGPGLPGAPRATPPLAPAAAPRRDLRRSARRAWIFVSSIPRTLVRLGGQCLRRPRARTVLLALGVPAEELPGLIGAELERLGEEPARTLVVTDTTQLSGLLSLGVGFEQVPARGSRQAELAGVGYAAFLAERLRLIGARRPRPRRSLALGDADDATLGPLTGRGGSR